MIIDEIKLKLDLVMYKGKTRLRQWYPIVLGHMKEIETTQNNLADKVIEDNEDLAQSVQDEAAERERVDGVLFDNIADAASALVTETAAREEAETNINNDIEILKSTAHTHDNKEILDAIDGERVQKWDSIESQVTQKQLDAVNDHLEDIAFGHERELHIIYTALGVEHYNGSLFGTPYDDDDLDGGDFDTEPENTIDFGDFEPMIIVIPSGEITDIIDGGDFSNTTGKVIDGGTY